MSESVEDRNDVARGKSNSNITAQPLDGIGTISRPYRGYRGSREVPGDLSDTAGEVGYDGAAEMNYFAPQWIWFMGQISPYDGISRVGQPGPPYPSAAAWRTLLWPRKVSHFHFPHFASRDGARSTGSGCRSCSLSRVREIESGGGLE